MQSLLIQIKSHRVSRLVEAEFVNVPRMWPLTEVEKEQWAAQI